MNADKKHRRLSAFMGVHLRPYLIFSHLAALSRVPQVRAVLWR